MLLGEDYIEAMAFNSPGSGEDSGMRLSSAQRLARRVGRLPSETRIKNYSIVKEGLIILIHALMLHILN